MINYHNISMKPRKLSKTIKVIYSKPVNSSLLLLETNVLMLNKKSKLLELPKKELLPLIKTSLENQKSERLMMKLNQLDQESSKEPKKDQDKIKKVKLLTHQMPKKNSKRNKKKLLLKKRRNSIKPPKLQSNSQTLKNKTISEKPLVILNKKLN